MRGKVAKASNGNCGHGITPPRMRGKDIPVAAIYVEDGITPAYAGKSSAHWQ